MSTFESLNLHDAIVKNISVDYDSRVIDVHALVFLDRHSNAVPCVLSWSGYVSLHLPRTEPWGPSIFVNSHRRDGENYYLEMQSGDVIEIQAKQFFFATH